MPTVDVMEALGLILLLRLAKVESPLSCLERYFAMNQFVLDRWFHVPGN